MGALGTMESVEARGTMEVRGSPWKREKPGSALESVEVVEAREARERMKLSHADERRGRRMTGRACEAPFLCYRFAEERALAK